MDLRNTKDMGQLFTSKHCESWEYVKYTEKVTSQLKIGKNLLLCLLYFVFCIIIDS